MSRLGTLGNDLYTGRRSVDIVGRARTWYLLSAVLLAAAVLGLATRGLTWGLEFTGGTEFRVATSAAPADAETRATDALRAAAGGDTAARVSTIGGSTVRVQTDELDAETARAAGERLADAFSVPADQVSSSLIGPSWGASVSEQALRALAVFLVLASVLMALYFRTWTMAAAAMVALAHDMLITVGIYVLSGFEVSPATVIGFLTVLGYSLYDTVVVFDKVRENTEEALATGRRSYADAANHAVNQTLVRSINTSVIAVLPILAVLVVGFAKLGPGTLLDLSLALFVGMTVGAFSSIFIATPLLVWLRRRDPRVQALAERAARRREPVVADPTVTEDAVTPAEAPAPAAVGSTSRTAPTGERQPAVDPEPRPRPDADSGDDPETPADAAADAADPDGELTLTGRKVHRYAQAARPEPRGGRRSRR